MSSKFNSLGEFLVATLAKVNHPNVRDKRLESMQNSLRESVGSEGGFLPGSELSTELLNKIYATAPIASRCTRIQSNSFEVQFPTIAETSRGDSSRFGGVNAGWIAEREQLPATKPAYHQLTLKKRKLAAVVSVTDELLQDVPALEAHVTTVLSAELAWRLDSAIMRGAGTSMPLGILNSTSLITVAAQAGQAAASIVAENLGDMLERLDARAFQNSVWLMSLRALREVVECGVIVGAAGMPIRIYDAASQTLFGRPIVIIEQASALGQVGDIVLADMSQYLILESPLRVSVSPHVNFTSGETAFKFVLRIDGQPMWQSPIIPTAGGASVSPFVTLASR